MYKHIINIVIVLFFSVGYLPATTAAPSTVVESNYLEGIESTVLVFSDHDGSQFANNINSVYGSAFQLLNQAQHSILLLNYVHGNTAILEIINRKAAEGVDVILVYDRNRSNDVLAKLHPSIKTFTRAFGDGHMHHKIIVVDREFNWISSSNFGGIHNKDLAVVFKDQEMAEAIYQESYCIGSLQTRKNSKPLVTNIGGQRLELYILPHNDPKNSQKIEAEMNSIGQQQMLKLINAATKTIRASVVVWTLKDSARALVQAAKRGVKVEVLGDNYDLEVLQILRAGLINPRKVSNTPYHAKWMLIDNTILWTGSANWSMNAFSRTDDSVTVLYDLTPEQVSLMEAVWQDSFKISK